MKFVTFNIQYGLGADGKYDLSRIAPAVAGADVIALQEVERFWQRTGMVDQPAEIAAALPDYHWVYGANLDMDASYRDGTGQLMTRRKQFGNMLLSKTPIISSRNYLLPKPGTLTHHGIQQGVLEAVIQPDDGPLRVYTTHLNHLSSEFRCQQLAVILDIFTQAPECGGVWSGGHPNPDSGWTEEAAPPMPAPAVLMGDFNMSYASAEYAMLVGPQSQKYGRVNLIDRFLDAWVLAGNGEDAGETCKAKPGESTGPGRIDYCFVSQELQHRVTDAWVDMECPASDHQPVWVSI